MEAILQISRDDLLSYTEEVVRRTTERVMREMQSQLNDTLITRTDAAERIGCDPKTLDHWSEQGILTTRTKIGGKVFYLRSEIESFRPSKTNRI